MAAEYVPNFIREEQDRDRKQAAWDAAHGIRGTLDEQAERNPAKTNRDNRDNRDTAPDKGFSDTGQPGQHRDNRDNPEFQPHFEVNDKGVFWIAVTIDKETGAATGYAAPEWICSPLRVLAMTRDAENGEWGRLLVFNDHDGKEHRWTCPQSLHAGSGDELRAVLLREGLTITTHPSARRRVGDYIQSERPDVRARCVNRTGWHGDVFALPRETFGDADAEPVMYQAATTDAVSLGKAGSLAGWIDHVAAPCAGNSRLVVAMSAAFAAPCAGLLGAEGGGVHLRGPSSCGKSTALAIASSVYGPPAYAQTWRATDNGIEGTCAQHTDMLLVLDEIGQLEPRHAGQVAYMIANGQGKARSHRDGSPRAITTWRVLFLSAGEVGIADLVTQSGGKVRAGQEVRVIDLPADAGAGLGLFDRVPAGTSPGAFADTLKAAAAKHHGHALPAFLKALVADPAKSRDTLRALRESIASSITPIDASGQVRRVADRFALIAAAGELATAYRLSGWTQGEAERAASSCFAAWLAGRGMTGDAEPAAILAQVRAFLEAHGESRFTRWDAPEDGARTINRAGFRKHGEAGPTYYVDRECFRRELSAGFDPQAVVRVLTGIGALQVEADGATRTERLPDGRRARVYVITPALWGEA